MSADFQTHIIQSVNGIFSSMAHGLARHIRGIEWAALRAALLYIYIETEKNRANLS